MKQRCAYLLIAFGIFFNSANAADVKCVSDIDCQQKWWLAQTWLEDNAYFKVRPINENKIISKAKSPAHKSRMEYELMKTSDGISLSGGCRSSIGCVGIDSKRAEFVEFVEVRSKVEAESTVVMSPRELWVAAHCEAHVASYTLRESWLGVLYEEECAQGEKRSLHVLRCSPKACVELIEK